MPRLHCSLLTLPRRPDPGRTPHPHRTGGLQRRADTPDRDLRPAGPPGRGGRSDRGGGRAPRRHPGVRGRGRPPWTRRSARPPHFDVWAGHNEPGVGTTGFTWPSPPTGTRHQALGEVLLNRATGSIGFIVGAAHRGQRLAVRALGAMTEYAHTTVARPQVILEIEPAPHRRRAIRRVPTLQLGIRRTPLPVMSGGPRSVAVDPTVSEQSSARTCEWRGLGGPPSRCWGRWCDASDRPAGRRITTGCGRGARWRRYGRGLFANTHRLPANASFGSGKGPRPCRRVKSKGVRTDVSQPLLVR